MLAQRSRLSYDGGQYELPLLVPSFSSKGSGYEELEGRRQYDAAGDLSDFARLPAQSVLLSAYDLHFKHLDLKEKDGHYTRAIDCVRNAGLLYIDSGGYELNESFDSCEPKVSAYQSREREGYDAAAYEQVLFDLTKDDKLPPLVLTNFDHGSKGKSLVDQATEARRLFGRFPGHITSFVIKPVAESQTILHPKDMAEKDVEQLRAFNIVGATEKELGKNLDDRLKTIFALRSKLNSVGISAPLHIWGGLDPMITPLYLFAGAQIFDGVSWLRYGYAEGVAVSRDSYQILDDRLGVRSNRDLARGMMTIHNRTALDALAVALQGCPRFLLVVIFRSRDTLAALKDYWRHEHPNPNLLRNWADVRGTSSQ